MKNYVDVEFNGGFYHIEEGGNITFMTYKQLDIVKQAWRDCPAWHPTDSLFTIIHELMASLTTEYREVA